jgi:hypothetical protein
VRRPAHVGDAEYQATTKLTVSTVGKSDDFACYIHHGTGTAAIDWESAITALDTGGLPSSAGEKRMLRLPASLADRAHVSLGDAITGIDERNLSILVSAVLHAGSRRQFPEPRHETRHHLHLPGMMWL